MAVALFQAGSAIGCGTLSQLDRGYAEMLFYVFAEKRGVWEAETVADLLHAEVGLAEVVAYVLHDVFGNPLIGRLARLFLADNGQILGRNTELAGV